ncbi:hypothetical protein OsI_08460 [Oryza sativa Indica Group]|uniref:Small ribosomal subunit protein uS15 N-terminal domain-containing protein n=1 Tax=Oryza sativa subsp. indica TaxID=39946 RepID=A2X8A3_ORYSI|nr:hypothetical protein OsI_08460 [Oryza sativa Indica Group]
MAAATGDEEDVEETQGYRIGRMATREAKDGYGRCRSPGLAMGDGRRKGISSSALPCKRIPPSLLKNAASDVEEMIMKAAKMGQMSSQIGVVLRHQHGIPLVKSIASSKILHILKAHGLAPKILEDLYFLIKKAVAIRKHLERNRKDKDSSFRLILVESRIHRLVRYYKRTKKLPPTLRSWIIFLEFSTVFSCSRMVLTE